LKHSEHYNQSTDQVINSLTHSLTLWSEACLEELAVTQLVKNFSTDYETHTLTTMFARPHQWTLSWARWSWFTPSHPISL